MIRVRRERPGDAAAIRSLHRQAFGGPVEAGIVDRLRAAGAAGLSLVADDAGAVVGHILFSEVRVGSPPAVGMGLAPMAVLPAHQRRGVGTALARRGLELLRDDGCPFVVVLGHPAYYPRFGFRPAADFGLACEFEDVPEEAFMAVELRAGGLDGVTGVVRYRGELGEAG